MTLVLLQMAHLAPEPTATYEIAVPSITTLNALRSTIQDAFQFNDEGMFGYEVLGCAAPGYRARLRDLVASGITHFRYLQSGPSKHVVEIVIVPPPQAAHY